MNAPPDAGEMLDLATQLVTAVIAEDSALILELLASVRTENARWLALLLAQLAASLLDEQAAAINLTAADLWSSALIADVERKERP